jgi:lipopolysaccharide/colanic/teichoic acid biosynthesis glycosyltransferase
MQEPGPNVDPRAARMLAFYSSHRFKNHRATNWLRLKLAMWVIQTKARRSMKRLLDLSLASVALVVFAPLMLLTALAIKLESPGPVLFRQTRVGKWGQTFICYKFRSMFVDAEQRLEQLRALNEADGPVFKLRYDPRVTRVGRIIRKTSIDELPQFFNVLKGNMSLVGPRPPVPYEVDRYEFDHLQRLEAVPGITGLQQVSKRTGLEFARWVELDVQYIQEQSLLRDIVILLRTIPAVITGKGAY